MRPELGIVVCSQSNTIYKTLLSTNKNKDIKVLSLFGQDVALMQLANVTGRSDYGGDLWKITLPLVIYGFYAMH